MQAEIWERKRNGLHFKRMLCLLDFLTQRKSSCVRKKSMMVVRGIGVSYLGIAPFLISFPVLRFHNNVICFR